MFRIGAFSKLTRVSVRMLRYYDDAGLLTPAVIDNLPGTGCIPQTRYLSCRKSACLGTWALM